MKTFNNLFQQIYDWDNLLLAYKRASEGRRFDKSVTAFLFYKERHLLALQRELREQRYSPGPYTTFYVYDPKQRLISAAPFRDRVVHHALCNVIEPIIEPTFIYDSYANRIGKGTHKAIERYQHYARRYSYVLKCDVQKFFPSIDHQLLKEAIRKKIRCKSTLWLIDTIIDGSNPQEAHIHYFPGDDLFTPFQRRRGLPIGNLTSQFWANVYLNAFDHFVKEDLQAPGYVRYVDDFVLFSNSTDELRIWKQRIADYLATIRMLLHPKKCHIHATPRGVPFLGFRVWPEYRIVRKERTRRYERHLQHLINNSEGCDAIEGGINSWLGHIRFGQCARLEYRVFWNMKSRGVLVFKHPNGSWRVLGALVGPRS